MERQDFVNLEDSGSEWVWDQGGDLGVGLERGVGLGPEGVEWVFVSGD